MAFRRVLGAAARAGVRRKAASRGAPQTIGAGAREDTQDSFTHSQGLMASLLQLSSSPASTAPPSALVTGGSLEGLHAAWLPATEKNNIAMLLDRLVPDVAGFGEESSSNSSPQALVVGGVRDASHVDTIGFGTMQDGFPSVGGGSSSEASPRALVVGGVQDTLYVDSFSASSSRLSLGLTGSSMLSNALVLGELGSDETCPLPNSYWQEYESTMAVYR